MDAHSCRERGTRNQRACQSPALAVRLVPGRVLKAGSSDIHVSADGTAMLPMEGRDEEREPGAEESSAPIKIPRASALAPLRVQTLTWLAPPRARGALLLLRRHRRPEPVFLSPRPKGRWGHPSGRSRADSAICPDSFICPACSLPHDRELVALPPGLPLHVATSAG